MEDDRECNVNGEMRLTVRAWEKIKNMQISPNNPDFARKRKTFLKLLILRRPINENDLCSFGCGSQHRMEGG